MIKAKTISKLFTLSALSLAMLQAKVMADCINTSTQTIVCSGISATGAGFPIGPGSDNTTFINEGVFIKQGPWGQTYNGVMIFDKFNILQSLPTINAHFINNEGAVISAEPGIYVTGNSPTQWLIMGDWTTARTSLSGAIAENYGLVQFATTAADSAVGGSGGRLNSTVPWAGIAWLSPTGEVKILNGDTGVVKLSHPNASRIDGLMAGAVSSLISNEGSINLTGNDVSGITARILFSDSNFIIDNKGTINISALKEGAAILVDGTEYTYKGITYRDGSLKSGMITNSGYLNIVATETAPTLGSRSLILVRGNNNFGSPISIINTGVMAVNDDFTYALLVKADSADNSIYFSNSGTVKGNTLLNNGDDVFSQAGGTYSGNINLGDGNNTFYLTEGVVTGDVISGAGKDIFTFSGGMLVGGIDMGGNDDILMVEGNADVSSTSHLSGGSGTDTLNILKMNLYGFTDISDDIARGVNLTQWEKINLSNSHLNLTGNLFLNENIGVLNISSGSLLTTTSDLASTINGNIVNSGTIQINTGRTGGSLTIANSYSGTEGSRIIFDTALGGDNSSTDSININGNTSGTTALTVNNIGGLGEKTIIGIPLIRVYGQSEGIFTQSERIVAGLYDYRLVKREKNWYLTNFLTNPVTTVPEEPTAPVDSPLKPPSGINTIRPEPGSYASNLLAANTLFAMSLHDRLGETQYIDALTGEERVTSMWIRNIGGHTRSKMEDAQNKTQANKYVIQLGGDIAQWSTDGLDRWHLGMMGGYANHQSNTTNSVTGFRSEGKISGYSAGLYGTWYQNNNNKAGLYIDSWFLFNWFDNNVKGKDLPTETYKSKGITASLESGYSLKAGDYINSQGIINSFWLQPQVQLTWMGVQSNDVSESNGTYVQSTGANNLRTRLGVRAYINGYSSIDKGMDKEFEPYVEANWIYTYRDFGARLNGTTDAVSGTRNIGELKVGLEAKLSNHTQIWGNVAQQIGNDGYSDTQGILGIRYSF